MRKMLFWTPSGKLTDGMTAFKGYKGNIYTKELKDATGATGTEFIRGLSKEIYKKRGTEQMARFY